MTQIKNLPSMVDATQLYLPADDQNGVTGQVTPAQILSSATWREYWPKVRQGSLPLVGQIDPNIIIPFAGNTPFRWQQLGGMVFVVGTIGFNTSGTIGPITIEMPPIPPRAEGPCGTFDGYPNGTLVVSGIVVVTDGDINSFSNAPTPAWSFAFRLPGATNLMGESAPHIIQQNGIIRVNIAYVANPPLIAQ
jgi:hypothetical protein